MGLNTPLMRVLPFAIDDAESNVFVWRSGGKVEKHCLIITGFLHNLVSRSLRLVDEIRVEDVKL